MNRASFNSSKCGIGPKHAAAYDNTHCAAARGAATGARGRSMMMPITMQYLKKATANNHFFGQEGALWAFHFETMYKQ